MPPHIISPSQACDPASDPRLAAVSDAHCTAAKAKDCVRWSTKQVRGVTDALTRCGAKIIGVTNPDFTVKKQIGLRIKRPPRLSSKMTLLAVGSQYFIDADRSGRCGRSPRMSAV